MQRDALGRAASDAIGRLEAWFTANGWRAFDFQREVWTAYLNGESGLVHSATGSGKTLAAALGPIAEWLEEQSATGDAGAAPAKAGDRGQDRAPPLRVLWITPMRALAGDTVLSIQRAIDGLRLPWTV